MIRGFHYIGFAGINSIKYLWGQDITNMALNGRKGNSNERVRRYQMG
jgi:hypothetical protein